MPSQIIRLFTIGFAQKSAEKFFAALAHHNVRRVIDVRLRSNSQLAGFAKQHDLAYFLQAIAGIEYVQSPELAPTPAILDSYKKHGGTWSDYETAFLRLMHDRQIEQTLTPAEMHESCLLCSEHEPAHCHRRLVAEYLAQRWLPRGAELRVQHLR